VNQTIQGNLTMTDDNWIGLGAAAGRMVFDDQATDYISFMNCNVGIGTASPLATLNIQADDAGVYNSAQGQLIISGSSNSNKRLNLGFNTTDNKGWIQPGINGEGYNDLLLNSQGGNVGIGTDSPDADTKLDVNGVIRAQSGIQPNGNAYSASEVLDDYEEGTFAGIVADSRTAGNAATMNATYDTGIYTRIGNICHINFRGSITSKGSMSGTIYVRGLPFAVASGVEYYESVSVGYFGNTTGLAAGESVEGFFFNGYSALVLYKNDVANGVAAITDGDLTDTFTFTISGWYQCA